jgi:hypothetical protein
MTTRIKFPRGKTLNDAGEWLDANMPNPPLPDPRRWSAVGDDEVEFADEQDATWFSLMWTGQ